MVDISLSEPELEYYYFGFSRILKSFRTITLLGWGIVLIGAVSLPLGWRFGQPHGLIDVALSIATTLAGVLVVQQGVAALASYINIPFDDRPGSGEDRHPAVKEIRALMKEIDDGGWWEANGGIQGLKEIGAKFELPTSAEK